MFTTPKALRLQIGLFGRTNVGKSSFLNMIAGQDVSITSDVPGTTTDVVEKTMELHSVGPVVFLDTAGLDDQTVLGEMRRERTRRVMTRSDVIMLVTEADVWTDYEQDVVAQARDTKTPVIAVVNKADLKKPSDAFMNRLKIETDHALVCSSTDWTNRTMSVTELERNMLKISPYEYYRTPDLMADLVPQGGLALLVAPIDMEAPKGRIKMLQVQTIREALDHSMMTLIVKETEYAQALARLSKGPDLVICDSPVVGDVIRQTPQEVKVTTFSTLLSRFKGDLAEQVRGAAQIKNLKDGDRVLIAEACTHHAIDEDIARVKIPRGLKASTGKDLEIEYCTGRDFPKDLSKYSLIIHCGGCMITRKEMLSRITEARKNAVAITNYGICISYMQGVLERVLMPFQDVLKVYQRTNDTIKTECLLQN